MRKLLTATVSAFALMTAAPATVFAGAVSVIDVSHIAMTTQAEAARAVDAAVDYAKQAAIYANQVEQYLNAVTNTIAIPQQFVNQVTGYYYRAQNVANTAGYIVSGDGSMMQRARMFSGMARGGANMPMSAVQSMAMIRQQAQNQLDENIRLLGLESERQAINNEMTAAAQANSAAAVGRMSALQTSAQNTAAVAANLEQTNRMLQNQIVAAQVKDSIEIAEDIRYGEERVADIEAARAQAASPASISSPIQWGR